MKDLLVGSTGFVGSNLGRSHAFEAGCHSTDIQDYYGSRPKVCVYAGVPAAMFLANTAPEKDLEIMKAARENLRRINPERVVLISTIAVYADSRGKDERDQPENETVSVYGANRRMLEQWVREDFSDALIVRLPALYGSNLKKNFLFDLHSVTPALLTEEKYRMLSENSNLVAEAYTRGDNGFFALKKEKATIRLRDWFSTSEFNALSFTDSRSRFQFYPLHRLWSDLCTALLNGLEIVHMSTPPVSAREVYIAVCGKDDWTNHLVGKTPFDYDLHSRHAKLLGGSGHYLFSKEEELEDVKAFMRSWREQEHEV